MNVGVIFAGGTGQRMNTKDRPKQFLEVHGKPIIVYTLEQFQNHPKIDGIVVVCVETWIEYCEELVEKYRLTKVKAVVPGGKNGQESIYNGIAKASELFPEDSVVLIHDGVRPLIDEKTITKDIDCVLEHGAAITVTPAIETITMGDSNRKIDQIIERSKVQLARAPQCFFLKEILDAHNKAMDEGLFEFIDSASMMRYYGHDLYTVNGPVENIKITTPSDFYLFRGLLDAKEDKQLL